MNKDAPILVVGHNDVIEKSLTDHFTANHFTRIFSFTHEQAFQQARITFGIIK